MPPEEAETILADSVAGKTETALGDKARLETRRGVLETRLRQLLEKINSRQLDVAEEMVLPDSEIQGRLHEVNTLLREVAKQYPAKEITETELRALETRLESLEAINPGTENRN